MDDKLKEQLEDMYWRSALHVEGISLEQAEAEMKRLQEVMHVVEQLMEIEIQAAESKFGPEAARAIREEAAASNREMEQHLEALRARKAMMVKGSDQPS